MSQHCCVCHEAACGRTHPVNHLTWCPLHTRGRDSLLAGKTASVADAKKALESVYNPISALRASAGGPAMSVAQAQNVAMDPASFMGVNVVRPGMFVTVNDAVAAQARQAQQAMSVQQVQQEAMLRQQQAVYRQYMSGTNWGYGYGGVAQSQVGWGGSGQPPIMSGIRMPRYGSGWQW